MRWCKVSFSQLQKEHYSLSTKLILNNLAYKIEFNLRSGVLFSEERERKATRDSPVSRWSVRLFPDRHSRVAILSRSSEKKKKKKNALSQVSFDSIKCTHETGSCHVNCQE